MNFQYLALSLSSLMAAIIVPEISHHFRPAEAELVPQAHTSDHFGFHHSPDGELRGSQLICQLLHSQEFKALIILLFF